MEQTIDVTKVSKLANLQLTESEISRYSAELSQILNFINKLEEVNTENINPSYSSISETNKFQQDKVNKQGNLDVEQFLSNHENTQDRYIKTTKVLDN